MPEEPIRRNSFSGRTAPRDKSPPEFIDHEGHFRVPTEAGTGDPERIPAEDLLRTKGEEYRLDE